MSNWYYKKLGQEIGPIPSSALKQLAATGQLLPDDAVRRDDMDKWTSARKVQGLFAATADAQAKPTAMPTSAQVPPALPPESTATVTPSTREQIASATASAASRMATTVKNAAVVTGKQAQLKTLEWEQHRADEAIGSKAFANLIGAQQFPDIYLAVKELDGQLAAKKQAVVVPASESIGDRAKRLAYEGKKKLDVELLSSERTKRLRELGEKLRANSATVAAPGLAAELQHAQEIESKSALLRAEIAKLLEQSPRYLRKALVALAAAAILVGLYIGLGSKLFSSGRRSSEVAAAGRIAPPPAIQPNVPDAKPVESQPTHPQPVAANPVKRFDRASVHFGQKLEPRRPAVATPNESDESDTTDSIFGSKKPASAADTTHLAKATPASPTFPIPWSKADEVNAYLLIGNDLWDVERDKLVSTDWGQQVNHPRIVKDAPKAIFSGDESRNEFGFAPTYAVVRGEEGLVDPYNLEFYSRLNLKDPGVRRAPVYLAADQRRIAYVKEGDFWRGDIDWHSGKVVNEKRLTTQGTFAGKDVLLWHGDALFIAGQFSDVKPIVRLDLSSGDLKEIEIPVFFRPVKMQIKDRSQAGGRAKTPGENRAGDLLFSQEGSFINVFNARNEQSTKIPSNYRIKLRAAHEELRCNPEHGNCFWLDDDHALSNVVSNMGRGFVFLIDFAAGRLSLLNHGEEDRFKVLSILPGNALVEMAEVVPSKNRYDQDAIGTKRWLWKLDDGTRIPVAIDPQQEGTWVSDKLFVYSKSTGGLNDVGAWVYDRERGESRKLSPHGIQLSGLAYLPERNLLYFSAKEGGGIWKIKADGSGLTQVISQPGYTGSICRIDPNPIDLGLGTAGESRWGLKPKEPAPNAALSSSLAALTKDVLPLTVPYAIDGEEQVEKALADQSEEARSFGAACYNYSMGNMTLGNFYDPVKVAVKLTHAHLQKPEEPMTNLLLKVDISDCAADRKTIEEYGYNRAYDVFKMESKITDQALEAFCTRVGKDFANRFLHAKTTRIEAIDKLFSATVTAARTR